MKKFSQYLREFYDTGAEPAGKPTEQKPAIVEQQPECDIDGICNTIKNYESKGNEKKIRKVYKDSLGKDTIGHGHLVTKESNKIFKEVFAEEHKNNPKFAESVLSGQAELNDEQMNKLLRYDVNTRLPEVKKKIPNLGTYSKRLQGELVSEYYRGLLPSSKNTISMINSGNLEGASKEYLNSMDYRRALVPKNNLGGVKTRIENLSNALKEEAILIAKKKEEKKEKSK